MNASSWRGAFLFTALLTVWPAISPIRAQLNVAPDGVLTGTVADEPENAPIRNAFIYVHGGARRLDVVPTVDGKGQFRAVVPPGLYDVFVAAGGFAPTCKRISVEPGKTTTYDPRLGADIEHLQQ